MGEGEGELACLQKVDTTCYLNMILISLAVGGRGSELKYVCIIGQFGNTSQYKVE